MTATYQYGTTPIPYTIIWRQRKTLAIEVHPDASVWVIAPENASMEAIQQKVEKRAAWIFKQQRFFEKSTIVPYQNDWVSGENIYYLGRQYRLKITEGKNEVKLLGKYLMVSSVDKFNKIQIESLVQNWYLKNAKNHFKKRLNHFEYILQNEQLQLNTLMVRKLTKRWGSCTKKGNILLNLDLIKFPVDCIDYVLVHEICHLKHHNHSVQYWNLLEKYTPNWGKIKHKLEGLVQLI